MRRLFALLNTQFCRAFPPYLSQNIGACRHWRRLFSHRSSQGRGPAEILTHPRGLCAGGGIDILARVLAESIASQLGDGHYMVVDNKPGANGQIAAQTLLTSPADGSTFLIAPLITPLLSQIVYKKPGYDPARDFAPVSLLAHFQFALAVPAKHPARNIQEYVAWLKANPEKANFGSPAVGGRPHFFGLLLGEAAGMNIVHVPYKGSPPMTTDLISGQLASAIQTSANWCHCTRKARFAFLALLALPAPKKRPIFRRIAMCLIG